MIRYMDSGCYKLFADKHAVVEYMIGKYGFSALCTGLDLDEFMLLIINGSLSNAELIDALWFECKKHPDVLMEVLE